MFKAHFDNYVIAGDSIECEVGGVRYVATLEADTDSHVNDCECYTRSQIAAWKRDEWHFFGVVISAWIGDVEVTDHAASLWGIEGNFPSRKKNPNKYFRTVANELLNEAQQSAAEAVKALRQRLELVA